MKISKVSARDPIKFQKIPYNDQVTGTGNRQEFRGGLHQPQNQGLENQQDVQKRSLGS